jgi:hypothetical protein
MRYMRHCHRREWLESIFSMIAIDKLPGVVKQLDDSHSRNEAQLGRQLSRGRIGVSLFLASC